MTPEKILVRGVNWLGDAVMTTPALLRLREAFPKTHITLLTHAKLKELWPGHPAVDAVEIFESGESPARIGRRLRGGKFDVGIVLPNSPRSAFEVWCAGIPRRIGYAQPWRNLLLNEPVQAPASMIAMHKRSESEIAELIQRGTPDPAPPFSAHHIRHYLHLVAKLGAKSEPLPPTVRVTPEEMQAAREKFSLVDQLKWLGINAGAEYGPAKRWPAEKFLSVIREASARDGWGVILFGGMKDAPEVQKIEEAFWHGSGQWSVRPRLINLAGRTSLRELMAALKICRVLVTNDSGPMHLAAALGTPVVALFGSTSPELTGPGLPGDGRHRILSVHAPCSPCFLRECPIDFRCMKGITVEQVIEAVFETGRER